MHCLSKTLQVNALPGHFCTMSHHNISWIHATKWLNDLKNPWSLGYNGPCAMVDSLQLSCQGFVFHYFKFFIQCWDNCKCMDRFVSLTQKAFTKNVVKDVQYLHVSEGKAALISRNLFTKSIMQSSCAKIVKSLIKWNSFQWLNFYFYWMICLCHSCPMLSSHTNTVFPGLDYWANLSDCRGQWEFRPYSGDTLGPSSKKHPLMEAEALVSMPHFYVGSTDIYGNLKVWPNWCQDQL